MSLELLSDLLVQAFQVLLLVLLPLIVGAFCSGLLAGAFQAVTSIRDEVLSYSAKLIVFSVVIYALFPVWVEAFQNLADFAWAKR